MLDDVRLMLIKMEFPCVDIFDVMLQCSVILVVGIIRAINCAKCEEIEYFVIFLNMF